MNASITYTVVTVLIVVSGRDKVVGQKSGPYDIIVKRLDACEDQGTRQLRFGTRINSRGNNVYTYTDNVTLDVYWDHLTKVDVEVQRLSNGVFTPRFITQRFKNCEMFWKFGGDMITDILKAANSTLKSCPIPKGNYFVHEWVVNIKLNNMPNMFYNSYKTIVNVTRQRIKIGCLIIYVEVVPKGQ